jgi:aminocarboxymuconate-semialdehyde decarboxylase
VHAIDTHCHFWPSEFLHAVRGGETFFGWTAEPAGAGRWLLRSGERRAQAVLPERDLTDAAGRLAARGEQQGIRMEAVMISGFLWNDHLPAADAAAFSRLVNDELADLERSSPGHVALAHLPMPHTRQAVAEVERCVGELGLTHFGVGSSFDGKGFDHPDIVPVVDAVAASGATLSTHPVFFGTIGTPQRLHSPLLRGGLASPVEAGLALTTLITSGVLDRHPEFRAWISHGGGAAMYAMARLDRRWAATAPDGRPTPRVPSDYLRRFWYGNLVHGDAPLRFLIDMVGADRITIGTDYPFPWDHTGGSANWIREHPGLGAREREAIGWRNAAAFLGIAPDWEEGSP